MLLIVAGRTAPNRAVRFGSEDDPLDGRGRTDVLTLRSSLPGDTAPVRRVLSGPERSVAQSALLLFDDVRPVPELTSLDVGRWRGLAPEEIPSAELGAWFADPASAPHGGESIEDFVTRIHAVADEFDGEEFDGAALVVAKPVAQALRCTGPGDFFAQQVRPASVHRLL